jgi:hypothetical protein
VLHAALSKSRVRRVIVFRQIKIVSQNLFWVASLSADVYFQHLS